MPVDEASALAEPVFTEALQELVEECCSLCRIKRDGAMTALGDGFKAQAAAPEIGQGIAAQLKRPMAAAQISWSATCGGWSESSTSSTGRKPA
jgi:hypothetical protein